MAIVFGKILVPVDFSANTEAAVRKAVELAGEEKSLIHLFHVERGLTTLEAKLKLNLIKSVTEAKWPSVGVMVHVDGGRSVRAGIIRMSGSIAPDLIVIGKRDRERRFSFSHAISPQYLAKMTRVPVLTVKPGNADQKIKTIIIPVKDVVPERKLEIARAIAQRYRSQVHLVTTGKALSSRAFVNTYRELREYLGQRVAYYADARRNLTEATASYAKSVMADLIITDPEMDGKFLNRDSRVQILDVV